MENPVPNRAPMPRPSYQPDPPARNTRARQPLTMEGEHQPTIHLEFFHGQPQEDGKSWLERFEYYVRYRTLNEQKQSDVFPVFMKDAAWKWFSSLPQDSKATIVAMKAAFKAQFDSQREPAEYAADLFQTTQGANQRVAEYLITIRDFAHRGGINTEQTLQAALHGLNPKLKPFVSINKPATLEELQKQREALEKVLEKHEPPSATAALVQAASQLTQELETMKLAQVNATTRQRQVQFHDHPRWASPHPERDSRHESRPPPRWRQASPSPARYRPAGNRRSDTQNNDNRRSSSRERRCDGCGGECISRKSCRAYRLYCNLCGKLGHLASVCRSVRHPKPNEA